MSCDRFRKKIAEYEVGESQMSYLEKLSFEVDGLRVLITNLSHLVEPAAIDPVYNKLRDEYQQAFAERQVALNEIVNRAAPDRAHDPNVFFTPDFYKGVIVAYEK